MSKEDPADFHRANKNRLGNWLVRTLLVEPAVKRAFGGVYACVDPSALKLRRSACGPVIFCMTHSGWFDGHIAFVLNDRVFHYDAYLMMEEVNLARYFFFTWMGVFGVDRDDVRSALASIDYICGMLRQGDNKALCVFPQGTMRHPDFRPLKLYGGVAAIARKMGRCAIVPVAIRYDFMMEQAPDAYIRVGAPMLIDTGKDTFSSKEVTNRLAEALTELADQLHSDITTYDRRPYRRLMSGRGSVNKLWDRTLQFAGRAKRAIPR